MEEGGQIKTKEEENSDPQDAGDNLEEVVTTNC